MKAEEEFTTIPEVTNSTEDELPAIPEKLFDWSGVEDIRVESKTCACVVTFFKESDWKTSRMNACAEHSESGEAATEIRNSIVASARNKKDEFLRVTGLRK